MGVGFDCYCGVGFRGRVERDWGVWVGCCIG